MVFQLVALSAIVAAASAVLLPHQLIPVPEAPAHYNFHYQVNDPLTGDQKHQEETREGDAVQGSYSLVEPDGSRRIVEYTADDVNGFQAHVHKEPLAHDASLARIAKPVFPVPAAPVHVASHVVSAPVVAKVASYPAIRGYPGAYSPYYSGLQSYSGYHPYSGYQLHSGYHPYSGVYSPYQQLNSYYH